MTKLSLPQWHAPEQVRDILLELPEKRRNRALYELIWQPCWTCSTPKPAANTANTAGCGTARQRLNLSLPE